MPASISIYLDSTTIDDAARAAWIARVSPSRAFELLDGGDRSHGRAANLHHALRSARGDAFVWLDCRASASLDLLDEAWQALRHTGAASASLVAVGESLTTLGVRVPISATSNRQLLFAPERAALYDRAKLLEAGGFDAALVEGHEDADAGWRLALRGEQAIALPVLPEVPAATFRSRGDAARHSRHLTTNELTTLFLCAGDDWLRRALPAALARLFAIAASHAGCDPREFDFGTDIASQMVLPLESLGALLAIDDFVRDLQTLNDRRARLQMARRRTDDELITLFESPVDLDWHEASGAGAEALCQMLGLIAAPRRAGSKAASRPESIEIASDAPPVSIVVLTMLGATHLPACLDSLARIDYPKESIEVIVVDNASADDPSAVVYRHYPTARVLRQPRNLGFCGGNNVGVSAATHDWMLFLNDDTKVEPGLLRALFQTARRRGAASVGAFVTDWVGGEVDFAGGLVNFEGRGFQYGVGAQDLSAWRQERPLLFANGAAMLVRRDIYSIAGGFPDRYFAYYEDVALGWAFWLLGYDVWLSGDALVHHRHHGSAATGAAAARERHCTRNALFTLTTHLADDILPDVLAAALIMAGTRVVFGLGLGGFRDDDLTVVRRRRATVWQRLSPLTLVDNARAELRRRGARRVHGLGGSFARVGLTGIAAAVSCSMRFLRTGRTASAVVSEQPGWPIPSDAMATLVGVAEWCRDSVASQAARDALQLGRRRSDSEVFSRFGENWLSPMPIDADRYAEYQRIHRRVIKQFRLARLTRRSGGATPGTL